MQVGSDGVELSEWLQETKESIKSRELELAHHPYACATCFVPSLPISSIRLMMSVRLFGGVVLCGTALAKFAKTSATPRCDAGMGWDGTGWDAEGGEMKTHRMNGVLIVRTIVLSPLLSLHGCMYGCDCCSVDERFGGEGLTPKVTDNPSNRSMPTINK